MIDDIKGYVQVYDNCDKAVASWLRRSLVWPPGPNGKRVFVDFMTPERAFAQIEERMHAPKGSTIEKQKVIPLPFTSINRLGETFDPKRSHHWARQRYAQTTEGSTTVPWPQPYNIGYSANFWGRTLRDLDWLTGQVRLLFGEANYTYLTVRYADPVGLQQTFFQLEEDRKMPTIDSAEGQPVFRREMSVRLDGWLFRTPLDYLLIDTVETDIYHDEGNGPIGPELAEVVAPEPTY
jgi:hypothetical protein